MKTNVTEGVLVSTGRVNMVFLTTTSVHSANSTNYQKLKMYYIL